MAVPAPGGGPYRRRAFSSRGTWPTNRSWCRLPRPGGAGCPRRGRDRRRGGLCRGPPGGGPWAARGRRPRGTGWLWGGSSGRRRPRRGAGGPRRCTSSAPPWCRRTLQPRGSPRTVGAASAPLPAPRRSGPGPRRHPPGGQSPPPGVRGPGQATPRREGAGGAALSGRLPGSAEGGGGRRGPGRAPVAALRPLRRGAVAGGGSGGPSLQPRPRRRPGQSGEASRPERGHVGSDHVLPFSCFQGSGARAGGEGRVVRGRARRARP